MHIMNCPACGKRIPINSPYCPGCNTVLTEYMQEARPSKHRFGRAGIIVAAILAAILVVTAGCIGYLNNAGSATANTSTADTDAADTDTSSPVGVYRGDDGNILVLNDDGLAYYYCSLIEYTELECPWEYKNGRLTVQFSKMHCLAYYDTDKDDFSEILLKADSMNWNAELFKKINVSPDEYLDRKAESNDPRVSVNHDGTMSFELDGISFTVPKQYWIPPSISELGEDAVAFLDADIDSDFTSVLLFCVDAAPAEEGFPARFLNGAVKGYDSEVSIAGRDATTCDISGTFNVGFPTLSGIRQEGTFTVIPNPDGQTVLYVLMMQTKNRTFDNTGYFESILKDCR